MDNNEKYYCCFDSPDNYSDRWRFHHDGGSPKILDYLEKYITDRQNIIEEINICLYLFNNIELHNLFRRVSELGVKVNVISIPLEGYDNTKPKPIINRATNKLVYGSDKSKYDLAVPIYSELREQSSGDYSLYIFPHMYIRSSRTRQFSRGNLPYSLHAKSLLIKFRGGSVAVGLTSSNLAVRDLVKEENLLIVENNSEFGKTSESFFADLVSQSIPVWEFDEAENWQQYKISELPQPNIDDSMFIAPFYKNSPINAEEILLDQIGKAKERILISGQHIASYKYDYSTDYTTGKPGDTIYRDGILAGVLKKASQGVTTVCLSQTFIDPMGSTKFFSNSGAKVDIRKPANVNKFREFVKELIKHDNTYYMVNSDIHSKYIIVDNTLILTTCNFTPTQFIYIDDVILPDLGYRGVFSEVGQFLIVKDEYTVNTFYDHFKSYWSHKNTVRYK